MAPRIAVLLTGTYRETEFILELLKHLAGPVDYDLFLVLRHVRTDETSRLGSQEKDFEIKRLVQGVDARTFCCELPSIDAEVAAERYLVPVGPTNDARECGMLSMFHGVFTAVTMLKASLRPYSHVLKTRSDYLPWVSPWLSGMLELYEECGRRIIVDGSATTARRYGDRLDIPWQGSISDLFSFSSTEQFLKLWDIEQLLPAVWTGIAETALYRAAMLRIVGDELQSHRRNDTFLRKHFFWEENNTKGSFHMLRFNVLTPDVKAAILDQLEHGTLAPGDANRLIRTSYDFISGAAQKRDLEMLLDNHLADSKRDAYMRACLKAAEAARPL